MARNKFISFSLAGLFLVVLKIVFTIFNAPHANRINIEFTPYHGIITGLWEGYKQSSSDSCGASCLAFILNGVGIKTGEDDIYSYLGKEEGFLSFSEMEKYVNKLGLKSQSLEVDKDYFLNNPTVAILHFDGNHFVVYYSEHSESEIILFDPAYGKVYISDVNLKKHIDGKILYIYT